jgi:hypothetical protein
LLRYVSVHQAIGVDANGNLDGDSSDKPESFHATASASFSGDSSYEGGGDFPDTASGFAEMTSELTGRSFQISSAAEHGAAFYFPFDGLGESSGGASSSFGVTFVALAPLRYTFTGHADPDEFTTLTDFSSTLPYDESPSPREFRGAGTMAAGESATFELSGNVSDYANTSGRIAYSLSFQAAEPTAIPLPASASSGAAVLIASVAAMATLSPQRCRRMVVRYLDGSVG